MPYWGGISLSGSRTRRAELDPACDTPTLPSSRLYHAFHCCTIQRRFEVQPGNNIALCRWLGRNRAPARFDAECEGATHLRTNETSV